MPDCEAVAVAREDDSHVLRALSVRDLGLLGVQVDRVTAELCHPRLEGVASASRLVEKEHEERLVGEEPVWHAVVERRLQLARDRQRHVDLLDRPVERLDVVAADEGLSVDRQL